MFKKVKISKLTFINSIILVFIMGVAVSPFGGAACNGATFVEAKSYNPLVKSSAVKSALSVQQAMREIYREVNPAVVRIETESYVKNNPFLNDPFFRHFFGGRAPRRGKRRKQQGLGSGFIIDKSGYIVTNNHVVAPNGNKVDKIKVKLVNGKVYAAKLIGSDSSSDIALLKIEAKNLKVSHIGDSDKIEVGDFAIAIGNPFGLSATFTMGVISSKGQDIKTEDGVSRIQTDAAINPGNSGGPLLNIKGEVIGINQMIYSKSGGSVGIGFAIPINYAMTILEKIKSGKKIVPGYVGLSIKSNVTNDELKELNLVGRKGLFVSEVELGSPAWKAGIRPYDFIVKIDSKKVKKFSDLKSKVVRKGPGKKLKIQAIREGRKRNFTIRIGERPSKDGR